MNLIRNTVETLTTASQENSTKSSNLLNFALKTRLNKKSTSKNKIITHPKIGHLFSQQKTIKRQKNLRQRRFVSFFKPQTSDSTLYKILDFLLKHHNKVLPVITVIREINTLIKTGNGEFNNYINEQHNFIGTSPTLQPVTYNFDLNNEFKIKSILRKLFGLKQQNNISISTK